MGEYNQYSTLNQTQLIYNDGDEELNPYQSLKVSFKMKTTSAKNDDLNNTMVEASIMGDYNPNNIGSIITTGLETAYSNAITLRSPTQVNAATDPFVFSNSWNDVGNNDGLNAWHTFTVPSVRQIMEFYDYPDDEIVGKHLIGLTVKKCYWKGDTGDQPGDQLKVYLHQFDSDTTSAGGAAGRFPASGHMTVADNTYPLTNGVTGTEAVIRDFMPPAQDFLNTNDAVSPEDATHSFYGYRVTDLYGSGEGIEQTGEGGAVGFVLDCEFVIAEEGEASDDTPRTLTTSEQFARNKKYGATIMTENASMQGDETRKSRVQMPDRYKNAIHIIKPNKDD